VGLPCKNPAVPSVFVLQAHRTSPCLSYGSYQTETYREDYERGMGAMADRSGWQLSSLEAKTNWGYPEDQSTIQLLMA
jgi:hypothetical protein